MQKISRQFVNYLTGNFIGNFLGFVVGFASTGILRHFFTTRSIKNLWGLTARKTVVDKQTYGALEWIVTAVIGFIVFEIISKWIQKKTNELLPKYKATRWLVEEEEEQAATTTPVPGSSVNEPVQAAAAAVKPQQTAL